MTDRRLSSLSWLAVALLAAVLYLVANGCGSNEAGEGSGERGTPDTRSGDAPEDPTATAVLPPADIPDVLGEWGQLAVEDGRLVLGDGVVPYDLNSALFSDYAHKLRTVWLPEGSDPARYDPDDVFDFPVGTVITKTFYYPVDPADADAADVAGGMQVLKAAPATDALAGPLDLAEVRLLETRILVRRADGWIASPYVWNEAETEATLQRTGDLIPLRLVDGDLDAGGAATDFTYVVPDVNQCASCHAVNHTTGEIQPIGPKARHLNAEVDLGDGLTGQLERWQELGLVAGMPDATDIPRAAVFDDDAASLDARARAYLDINCAHCHNVVGPADTSGLFLEPATEVGPELGVCKLPIAAGTGTGGRLVGIEPGRPDQSIFMFRLESTDPAAMMPELGRALAHDEGVDLLADWIASLEGDCDDPAG